MTRKQRSQTGRNITYDLSSPRNLTAFEALLEDDEGEGDSRQQRKSGSQQQGRKKREKEKFFMLRTDAAADCEPSPQPASQQDQIQQLMDLFQGSSLDKPLATDVYQACGSSLEAAAEALFGLLGGHSEGPAAPDTTSTAAATAAGASSSSAGAQAAAAALHRQQQQQQQAEFVLCWHDLPPDVCSSILSRLTPQDLARVASTCSEFRDRANAMRAHVRHLVLQPGVSYSCLKGMVSSHVAAAVMDFTRFERHMQHKEPLKPLTKGLRRLSDKALLQEAEAGLFRGLLAVAEGSTASCRTTPVTGLVLKGLLGLTDRVLAEALNSFKGLRWLDISHCPSITNKSFYLLAKHKATQGLTLQHEQQQQQQQHSMTTAQRGQGQPQQQHQQQHPSLDDEDELLYSWPSSSSSSSSSSDDGSTSSGEDDGVGDEVSDAALRIPADIPEQTADAAAVPAQQPAGDEAASQQAEFVADHQQQPQQLQGSSSSSQPAEAAVSVVSSANAAAVSRQMAALEIQAALFVRPQQGVEGDEVQAVSAAAGDAAPTGPVGLQELKLSGNNCLLDDGLRQVLQHPVSKHSLTKLDVSGCRNVTAAGLIIPPLGVLRELKACRCSGLRQLVVLLPGEHPLSQLDLSACHYLQLVDLHLAGLTSLNLSACRTLYRLRMRCPSLQSLSLAQCGMLYDFHEDAWQVPALQQLNMFGCRRASGAQLQAVLDKLTALKWLSLNGCYGITRLHLTRNLELQSVDVSGCRALSALSCASPALQQLTAASASHLRSLTLATSSMKVLLLANCKQLVDVHVSAPALATELAAGVGAGVDDGRGQHQVAQAQAAVGADSSSRGSAGSSRQQRGPGVVLDTRGCVSLSAEMRAGLAAAMLAQ